LSSVFVLGNALRLKRFHAPMQADTLGTGMAESERETGR